MTAKQMVDQQKDALKVALLASKISLKVAELGKLTGQLEVIQSRMDKRGAAQLGAVVGAITGNLTDVVMIEAGATTREAGEAVGVHFATAAKWYKAHQAKLTQQYGESERLTT